MKTILKSTALALALSFSTFANAQTAAVQPLIQQIKTQDGLNLHSQKDMPNTKPKVVVISHGLASHSGVFGEFAKTLNDNAIAVYRFDHRGHGKSDGRDTIHINNYFEMVEDLRLVVEKPNKKTQTRRCLCWVIRWADTSPHFSAQNIRKGRTALFWRRACCGTTR